ncbi:MAG: hypothetical protein HY652_03115 [Acidobacteria bacterium]|nr:hypothetical protein [Acidobacteriota bacterium]
MKDRTFFAPMRLAEILALAWLAALGSVGCSREKSASERVFPEPRYPAYLKLPRNVEEIMPYARAAVRQTAGRTPLGLVEQGKTVALFAGERGLVEPNPLVLEALVEAYKEVGVKPLVVLPEPQEGAVRLGPGYTSEDGYMEVGNWVRTNFVDAEEPKTWLRLQTPGLYEKMFPSPPRQSRRVPVDPNRLKHLREHPNFIFWGGTLKEYLDRHGEKIDAVFAGYGGRPSTRKHLGEHGHKFYSNFVLDDYREVMSKIPSYPGDLWRLVEERILEPLAWADRVHITDPEGTDISFDLTEQQARDWFDSAYLPGHLLLHPGQGSMQLRSPFFPKMTRWIEPFSPHANGVIAGTRSHTGVYPRIEVTIERGKVKEVKGGGDYGDAWRAFLRWSRLAELRYPYHEKVGPGYLHLFECSLGTNPKYFARYDEALLGRFSTEREVAGVIHWGFGVDDWGFDRPGEEGTYDRFLKKSNAPRAHGFHIHNLFITYKVRIRGTHRWITLVEKGRIAAFSNPEVRLLASRYGNPDELLRAEWIPNIPGINAPGDYQKDYARYPWSHITKITKQIDDGTYPYLHP